MVVCHAIWNSSQRGNPLSTQEVLPAWKGELIGSFFFMHKKMKEVVVVTTLDEGVRGMCGEINPFRRGEQSPFYNLCFNLILRGSVGTHNKRVLWTPYKESLFSWLEKGRYFLGHSWWPACCLMCPRGLFIFVVCLTSPKIEVCFLHEKNAKAMLNTNYVQY